MKTDLKNFNGIEYLLIHAETAEETALLQRFGADKSAVAGNLRQTEIGCYLRFELPVTKTVNPEFNQETPCRACGAKVMYLKNNRTAKLNPINTQPSESGNIRLLGNGEYEILNTTISKGQEYAVARAKGEPLYTSHFATCPNAKDFRKSR